MNFKTTTDKDIFLTKLKGEELNFGFINREDKPMFFDFAIKHKLMIFICHKEYRGILGLYKVLKDFSFDINRNDGMDTGTQFISVNIGDEIEVSELYPMGQNYSTKYTRANSPWTRAKRHQIYRYVTDAERAKIYEM